MIANFSALLIITSIACFLLNILTLVSFTYVLKKRFALSIFLKINITFALIWVFFSYFLAAQNNIVFNYERFIIALAVFFQLSFVLFNLINAHIGSLRIRIIEEIYSSRNISLDNLKKKYSSNEFVEIRILRLVRGNQLRVIKNRLVISSNFILFVFYIFHYLKLLTYKKSYRIDRDKITI